MVRRTLCVGGQFRSSPGRRSGAGGTHQRCGTAALWRIDPDEKGCIPLLDCGANVDSRPSHLVQFARMGSIYMEHVIGIKNPRVGIVNIGAEKEKGNALVKETFPLLKQCTDINFTGSIEAREIPHGGADVIVCEAFTGNVILKLYEGTGAALISMVKKGLMSSCAARSEHCLLNRL